MIKLSEFMRLNEAKAKFDVGDRLVFGKEGDGIEMDDTYEIVYKDETQYGLAEVGENEPTIYLSQEEIIKLKPRKV